MFRGLLLALAAGATLCAADRTASDLQPDLRPVLVRDLKFSPGELADLEHGKVVRHTLPVNGSGEVAAVGAIRIHATKERFVAAYRDIVRFKKSASVLEIGRFSSAPVLADLDGLSINRDDFDLRRCKVGDCDIRLPASDIRRVASEIDWTHPDADAKAAALFKQILLDDVHAYTVGGPGRIIEYDDDKRAIMPVEDFVEVLKNSPYVDAVLPGLG